jgi:alpha-1,6-mannosyltransferase
VRLLPVASGQPWLTIFVGTAAAGVAVLVAAWWLAGRTGRLEPRWVAATAALWAMPLVLLPPLFSRDVYSYAAQGDVLAHGLDPYTDGPADVPSQWLASISPTWADTPAPYGPLFLQLAHLAVRVSAGYLPAVVLLLRLVAIAGVLLVAVYLPRLARACGTDPGRALWLGLASPLLITHFVSGAHNDALMVGLIVAGLAYAAERNGFAAAVAIALAAAVKAPALATLPFAALLWAVPPSGVQRRPVKAAALTAGTAAATFAAVTAATGLGTGWIGAALDTPGASVQWTSVPTAIGIAAGWVTGPAAAGTALATARTIGTLLTVIAIAALIWRAWRNRDDTRVIAESAGLALLAAVVLAPAFHPWYLLWAAVPLAASARRTQALAIASAALCFLVLPDGYNLARSTEVPGVLLVLATLVTLTVLAVRRRAGVGEEPVTAGAAP